MMLGKLYVVRVTSRSFTKTLHDTSCPRAH
jgi:hypothetical protein